MGDHAVTRSVGFSAQAFDWGKTAEIVEKYVVKGKEVGISGKLKTRSYTNDDNE